MVINLTPKQFEVKLASLHAKDQKLITNGNAGMLSNGDVTLSYSYDGIGVLTVIILQKHSLRAKLASAGIIEKSINGFFAAL